MEWNCGVEILHNMKNEANTREKYMYQVEKKFCIFPSFYLYRAALACVHQEVLIFFLL